MIRRALMHGCCAGALAIVSPAFAQKDPELSPEHAEPTPDVPAQPTASYRLTGERELFPSLIVDDGSRTYIEWPLAQPLPAVFAINARGQEEMVEGYMRAGRYTIDRVYYRLAFRIDKARAVAVRVPTGDASR